MISRPTPELFRHFPELRETLPWAPLARPTPVERLHRLECYLQGHPQIWIKRDERTSELFPGSLARALEFVCGAWLRHRSRRVLAIGHVDDPRSLALAAFARHLHVELGLALRGRPEDARSRHILRRAHALGAQLYRLGGGPRNWWRLGRALRPGRDGSGPPWVLWPRRRALLETLGMVNGAYELKRQIRVGLLPRPGRIYVPVTSGAACAGLALGCALAGIETTIVGVLVPGGSSSGPARLATRARALLRRRVQSLPGRGEPARMEIRRDVLAGRLPALPQHRGLLRDLESLSLDLRSTAASMLALVDDVRARQASANVLFWNTWGGLPEEEPPVSGPLPEPLRSFFVVR